ncbi:MAG TPA: type II toxin-antitoxin system Phd/YefM family antitoxin [Pirellulales bacterium]|jgi:prevent-host-death family protein
MKVVSVADVKAHFSAYVKESEKGPVVVTRNGKPVAALIAVGDGEDLERLMMAHSPRLQEILESARRRFRAGKGIPADRFWKDLDRESKSRSKRK